MPLSTVALTYRDKSLLKPGLFRSITGNISTHSMFFTNRPGSSRSFGDTNSRGTGAYTGTVWTRHNVALNSIIYEWNSHNRKSVYEFEFLRSRFTFACVTEKKCRATKKITQIWHARISQITATVWHTITFFSSLFKDWKQRVFLNTLTRQNWENSRWWSFLVSTINLSKNNFWGT